METLERQHINIEDEMRRSYLDYAMSVIIGRALPDVRMSRLANEVLADIAKETVDFQSNYDESLSEPTVLPARIPNLLLNGSEGIAVGMSTKIAPHNLTEVVDATIAVLRDPEIDIEDLLRIVNDPDFPTRGF